MSNILFYAAGRRIEMANRFKARGHTVSFAELDMDCPVYDEGYNVYKNVGATFNELLALCKEASIEVIVPFSCQSVYQLSLLKYKMAANGIKIVCPETIPALDCYDKENFSRNIQKRYYPHPSRPNPIIWKPKNGNGGNGFHKGIVSLPCPIGYVEQDELYAPELSCDAWFNLQGKFVAGMTRVRTRIAGGEILDGHTISNPKALQITKEIGEFIGISGPVCAQYMTDRDGLLKCTEVNARFGGGCTLSLQAGLPMLRWLEDEYILGKLVESNQQAYLDPSLRYNLKLRRSYKDHYFI